MSPAGINSVNRPEWIITALAALSLGALVVPLYDTLGADAVRFIVDQCEPSVVFINKSKVAGLTAALPHFTSIKTVVQFDTYTLYRNTQDAVSPADKAKVSECGKTLVGFAEFEQSGVDDVEKVGDVALGLTNEPAYLMYTSGTTGSPKGVLISHLGLLTQIVGTIEATHVQLSAQESYLSYLPLAHILETHLVFTGFFFGGKLGFYNGNPKYLNDDIKLFKPTIFAGVPRVYSRFHDVAMAKINALPFFKRKLALSAIETQNRLLRRGLPLRPNKIFDRLAEAVREASGFTNLTLLMSGGAPCPPYVMLFLKGFFAPKMGVIQGYGMTETASGAFATVVGDHTLGHVGSPTLWTQFRLRDVPDMGYMHSLAIPTGEIELKSPGNFLGYYKNEQETKATLTADGWLKTGDIGRLNPNGSLSIIDRKKNLFKLSHGEYIASERLENMFMRSGMIAQIYIYGNSYKSFVLAVVVPDITGVVAWAKEHGTWDAHVGVGSPNALSYFQTWVATHRDALKERIMHDIAEIAGAEKLHGFEKPKDIVVETDLNENFLGFTEDNDCLTPTYKLKRHGLLRRYREALGEMYAKNGEPPTPGENW
eukprot:TRINITY_DN889_c0_g1_i1.p1 TRINITY_DN889_c0_g1~~TRINITY_DN889_c0_g1_i1.p1  ORF type:complete len:596 (-),score=133.60 TRINITY_DN889_c0_g1_i1:58-1845(-)